MIDKEIDRGYKGSNASAKVCQDLILKAMAKGPLNRNVTVKGGVVMRSKTGNIRRATQDLDIDFIRYSLSNEMIDIFIEKLNCIEGIIFKRSGKIEELKQQDYKGKCIYITIEDTEGNRVKSKIDLGVHNHLELEQEEYCFDIAYDEEKVSLLINSNEQMFTEKLRSLLKFGTLSTRFKDIFDMYYLKEHINISKLYIALDVCIFKDSTMREKSGRDIARRLAITFRDKEYVRALEKTDKRWIDEDINTVFSELLEFIKKLEI